MKISTNRWLGSVVCGAVGPGIILREALTPLQRASLVLTAWQVIARLGTRLETVTLMPVTAIIVLPLFLYLLITRGYYEIFFGSKSESRKP